MEREQGLYERYVKRILDIICSLLTIILFWWLYLIIGILVKIQLGSPVIFKQPRPGMIDKHTGKEKIFYMYKYRTMTNQCNEQGVLLPDEKRLTKFGSWLRRTSLDELPEVFNIFKGDMSVIGPRPQLVRDMVFMTDRQRMRHTAKQGLSGLAQVNGRNAIKWEDKFEWDLKYIQKISFINDMKIVIKTVHKAIIKREGITGNNMSTVMDYGDYLLKKGKVSEAEYNSKQQIAKEILCGRG